jgi:hypothetical protein
VLASSNTIYRNFYTFGSTLPVSSYTSQNLYDTYVYECGVREFSFWNDEQATQPYAATEPGTTTSSALISTNPNDYSWTVDQSKYYAVDFYIKLTSMSGKTLISPF